jgi:hypothetical protein
MKINIISDGKAEITFSWKEIWILIKNKKLIIESSTIDNLIVALINLKHYKK